MVLLAVLGALGVIYIMIVQMSADAVFASQYYSKIQFKERSYYISRSAYSAVNQLLGMDDENFDCLRDPWAQEIPPYHIDDEQVYISFVIEDQERFFNPNYMIQDADTVETKHQKQFQRLLEGLELDPDMSNAFLDWMDTDQERRMPLGADGMDYPTELPSKGGKMDSLEEVKLIKGVAEDAWTGRLISGRALPGLKDLLTVHSSGMVNINTARSEIIKSLDDEMTNELAAEIIRRREQKPIENMDELLEMPGMNSDLLFRIKQLADVKSEYFKVTFTVENYDKESSDLVVIVKRSGTSGKIVYWQAN